MKFTITHAHHNVVVLTYEGVYDDGKDWEEYEAAYRALLENRTQPVTVIFDLRRVALDFAGIVQFVMRKRVLLTDLKADTCRRMMAAIILTDYDAIRDIVTVIAKASGQASLFYAVSSVADAVETATQLVCVINGVPRPLSSPDALTWGDLSHTNMYALLLCSFLRVAKHFIARGERLKKLA